MDSGSLKTLIIGTRGSPLALWQVGWVKERLTALVPGIQISFKEIKTTGDKMLDVSLAKVGGKGLFLKEIEEALLAGEVDIAVHSMKDVPVTLPKGLVLGAMMAREDPRDVFVSRRWTRFFDLPQGARVGTSSLRRRTQLLHHRPDLKIVSLRGNVGTRLKRLEEGSVDAIILAAAGMKRLNCEHHITEYLETEILLPAVGQGCVGIEARDNRQDVLKLITLLNDPQTQICVEAERHLLQILEGGCQAPIGVYGTMVQDRLTLVAKVLSYDGQTVLAEVAEGSMKDPGAVARHLGDRLIRQGAQKILQEVIEAMDNEG